MLYKLIIPNKFSNCIHKYNVFKILIVDYLKTKIVDCKLEIKLNCK